MFIYRYVWVVEDHTSHHMYYSTIHHVMWDRTAYPYIRARQYPALQWPCFVPLYRLGITWYWVFFESTLHWVFLESASYWVFLESTLHWVFLYISWHHFRWGRRRKATITSSHHHIITSSHHHIIILSHHHIITSSHHHSHAWLSSSSNTLNLSRTIYSPCSGAVPRLGGQGGSSYEQSTYQV